MMETQSLTRKRTGEKLGFETWPSRAPSFFLSFPFRFLCVVVASAAAAAVAAAAVGGEAITSDSCA